MARPEPSGQFSPTFLLALPVVIGLAWWGPSAEGGATAVDPVDAAAAESPRAAADGRAPGGLSEAAVRGLAGIPGPDDPTAEPVKTAASERRDGEASEASEAAVRSLRGSIERLLPVDRWRSSEWGVLVTSLDRGDTLFARGAHQTLAPASNLKLLTTAAALHHLGDDFRFRTFLLSRAPVRDGRLAGDLVLYGTGDPTLADDPGDPDAEPLRAMARDLRARGIEVVEGDVVGDGSYFGEEIRPDDWGSRSLNEWFATPVASLQYNENVATLRIRPGARSGSPVTVEVVPDGAPVPIEIQAETVGRRTRHPVWTIRESLEDPVVLTGQQELDDPEIWRRMPVPDPALYAASRLRLILEEEGIEVRGEARSTPDKGSSILPEGEIWAPGADGRPAPTVLAEHQSSRLIELLRVINHQSHNLYAESVARTLGRIVDGEASFEGGARVIRRFLVEDVGVPEAEVHPRDGSGLSHENRLTPYALVRLLDHMSRGPHWESFWSTLPEAGNWRQLRRMYGTPAAGNLRAKTGTLRSVSALTGLVEARNGERIAFSIVSNDVPSTSMAKAVEDRIGVRLASFSRPLEGSTLLASADVAGALEE